MDDHRPNIPDHDLLRKIGKGSYGEVWLARNVIGTYRAVKIVYKQKFEHDRPYDREFAGIQRFEPISRAHDGLVDVLQVGRNENEGYFYYVMEIGDDRTTGQDITPETYRPKTLAAELFQRKRLPCEECLNIGLAVTAAVGYIHQRGLVHRDIKPSNIIFVNGMPKVADVGLVADFKSAHSFVGTEGFIPPEGPGDPSADVYSLGKVIYEVATGNDRRDFPSLPANLLEDEHRIRLLEINEIILKACETREKRYETARELHDDLVLLQDGKSIKRLRILEKRITLLLRVGLVAAAFAIIAGLVGVQIIRERKRVLEQRHELLGKYVGFGSRSLQEGDYLGSLPWFVEALRLAKGDPASEEAHRIRIASILQRSPSIIQMWALAGPMYGGQFSRNGREVLLRTGDGMFQFFDVATGRPCSPGLGRPHFQSMASWSEAAQLLATTEFGGRKIDLWRIQTPLTPQAPLTLDTHRKVACVELSTSGKKLITGFFDGTAVVWETDTGKELARISGHTDQLLSVVFDASGSRVATTSADGTAKVWNAETGALLCTLSGHRHWVNGAAFHPDGVTIATASLDNSVRIWNASNGNSIALLPHNGAVHRVQYSSDGRYLVAAGWDFATHIWNVAEGRLAFPPLPHAGRIMTATLSPDSRRLLTVGWNGSVVVWDLNANNQVAEQKYLSVSQAGDKQATWRDSHLIVQTLGPNSHERPMDEAQLPLRMQFSANGTILTALSGADGKAETFSVWEVESGKLLLQKPASGASNLLISASGTAAGFTDGTSVQVWSTYRGEILWDFRGRISPDATINRSGTLLALAEDNNVSLWKTGGEPAWRQPIPLHTTISRLEFSPNGRVILAACSDASFNEESAQLIDVATGLPSGTPFRHRDGVLFATFSNDGHQVLTCSEDGTAILWDAKTARQLHPPFSHRFMVRRGVFSQDGKWIATLAQETSTWSIHLWDAQTGEPIALPFNLSEPVVDLQFSAGARELVAYGTEGKSWTWTLPREDHPIEDLALMAQLLSAHQNHYTGSLAPETKDEIYNAWLRLKLRYPNVPEQP